MPQGIDDFTIVLPELTEMAVGDWKVYYGLDRLWRMVERYKMTVPIAIRVVDNKARCVRTIRRNRYQAAWQLEDETTAAAPPLGGGVEFPLTINEQDAKGNILKMSPKDPTAFKPFSRLIEGPGDCVCPGDRPAFDRITSSPDASVDVVN